MANSFYVDGVVGKVTPYEKMVIVRMCHKERYFSKKDNDWVSDDHWLDLMLIGNNMKRAMLLKNGDVILALGALNVYPKEGKDAKIRLRAHTFFILDKHFMKREEPAEEKDLPGFDAHKEQTEDNFDDIPF